MTVELFDLLLVISVVACVMFWVADRGYNVFGLFWGVGLGCFFVEVALPVFSITNDGIEILIIVIALLFAGTIGLIGGFYNYTSRENEAWKRYKMSRSQGGLHD